MDTIVIYRFLLSFMVILISIVSLAGCDTRQGVKIGDNPPAISGADIHGNFVSLNQYKGKVVIIFFWTNSCCGDRVILLEPFYQKNKDKGLSLLAVNVGDSKEIVESYTKSNSLSFTFKTDEHAMTSTQYGVIGFPTTFILDRNGIVREKILGDIQPEKLQALVARQFKIQRDIEENYEKIHRRY